MNNRTQFCNLLYNLFSYLFPATYEQAISNKWKSNCITDSILFCLFVYNLNKLKSDIFIYFSKNNKLSNIYNNNIQLIINNKLINILQQWGNEKNIECYQENDELYFIIRNPKEKTHNLTFYKEDGLPE